jgi:ATP-binding cassette subfamily F protein uup
MGNKTIEIRNLAKSYGDKCLFRDFSYMFQRNDRIGIIGPNGCGKSTLLKILTGEIEPDEGSVEIGQTIKMSCFSQENEKLPSSGTVIDAVKETGEYVRTADGLITASAMCERFLFSKGKQYTPIEKLSGGEKRRLYLLRILMEAPNVLILDEPTNDLDIQTLQILEDYLDHFSGIVIAVSHDRYFLDRVVNRIFSFEGDGHLHQSEGGYDEYLAHKEGWTFEDVPESPKETESPKKGKKYRADAPQKKLTYSQQREYDSIEGVIDELTEKRELIKSKKLVILKQNRDNLEASQRNLEVKAQAAEVQEATYKQRSSELAEAISKANEAYETNNSQKDRLAATRLIMIEMLRRIISGERTIDTSTSAEDQFDAMYEEASQSIG